MARLVPRSADDCCHLSKFKVFGAVIPRNAEIQVTLKNEEGPQLIMDVSALYIVYLGMNDQGWPYIRCISKKKVRLNGQEVSQEKTYLDTAPFGRDEVTFPLLPRQRMSFKFKTDGVEHFISASCHQD